MSPPVIPQTNVDLAHSTAVADSDGDVAADEADAQRTGAFAGTTGLTNLLGEPIVIQEARATAPPSETVINEPIIEIPADPLLNLDVIETRATANWVSDTACTAATDPLSLADQELADAVALAPEVPQSVLEVDAGEDGAADVEASTFLPATGGPLDQRAIAANVTTRLAGVDVFNNFVPDVESAINVRVIRAPNYTVQATGIPGGASVTGDDPIVEVTLGGETVIEVNASTSATAPIGFTLTELFDGLDPLLSELEPLVRLSVPVTKNASADGTTASVDAAILRLEVLAPDATGATEEIRALLQELLGALTLDVTQPLLVLEISPMQASVTAPVGGIRCQADNNNPVELQKNNSGPAIPGQTFDYTIGVGNVGDCTLTNVAVTDVVTGPAGSTVVLTEPTATSVGAPTPAGPGLENIEIKWADVGPIAPDARVTLRIRVKVPANATVGQRYSDRVTVTGVCDGRPVDRTVTLNEPPVEAPGTGPCNLTGSNKTASHIEVFPGEQFNFLINVFNDSGEACTNITVTDTLSEKVTFVSCSDNCTVNGRTITWNIANLGPGSSTTLRVTVSVNAGATGTIPNSAVIDTPTTNPVTVNTPGPTITDRSVLNANQPAGRSQVADLARTGPSSPLAWPVALGLGIAAFGFQRLRRRATAT